MDRLGSSRHAQRVPLLLPSLSHPHRPLPVLRPKEACRRTQGGHEDFSPGAVPRRPWARPSSQCSISPPPPSYAPAACPARGGQTETRLAPSSDDLSERLSGTRERRLWPRRRRGATGGPLGRPATGPRSPQRPCRGRRVSLPAPPALRRSTAPAAPFRPGPSAAVPPVRPTSTRALRRQGAAGVRRASSHLLARTARTGPDPPTPTRRGARGRSGGGWTPVPSLPTFGGGGPRGPDLPNLRPAPRSTGTAPSRPGKVPPDRGTISTPADLHPRVRAQRRDRLSSAVGPTPADSRCRHGPLPSLARPCSDVGTSRKSVCDGLFSQLGTTNKQTFFFF